MTDPTEERRTFDAGRVVHRYALDLGDDGLARLAPAPPTYRPGLPPVPRRLLERPIVHSYPLPWFVAERDGQPIDFRVADGEKLRRAITEQRCWVCGQRLGGFKAFLVGPMCVVNRISAEPPMHTDCAEWTAEACPFLNQQMAHRRTTELPPDAVAPPGEMITRQAGATVLWVARHTNALPVDGGWLFYLGTPTEVRWYCEGRAATRAEALAALESGVPTLQASAEACSVGGPRRAGAALSPGAGAPAAGDGGGCMKALTLTQPWATLVAIGAKRIETRSWSTSHRGPLAIHAGAGLGPVGGAAGLMAKCRQEPFRATLLAAGVLGTPQLPRGAIVAIATLVDVVPIAHCLGERPVGRHDDEGYPWVWELDERERAFVLYCTGRYGWLLADVRRLPEPIPARGGSHLWEWEPPAGWAPPAGPVRFADVAALRARAARNVH